MKTATWFRSGISSSPRKDRRVERGRRRSRRLRFLNEALLRLGHLPAGRTAHAGVPAFPRRADRHDRRGKFLRLHHHRDHSGLHPAELRGAADLAGDLADLSADAGIHRRDLGAHPRHRLHHRLLPRLPCPLGDLADRAVPGLHHSVLDLQHHPHDLVDPVPRPQRAVAALPTRR